MDAAFSYCLVPNKHSAFRVSTFEWLVKVAALSKYLTASEKFFDCILSFATSINRKIVATSSNFRRDKKIFF